MPFINLILITSVTNRSQEGIMMVVIVLGFCGGVAGDGVVAVGVCIVGF